MVSMTEVFAAQIWEAFQGLMAHHGAKLDPRYGNITRILHGASGYPVFIKDIDGGFIRFHLEHLKGESYEVMVCYPGMSYGSVISSFGLDVDSYIDAIIYLTDTVIAGMETVTYESVKGERVRQGKAQIHPTVTEEARDIIAEVAKENGISEAAAIEIIARRFKRGTEPTTDAESETMAKDEVVKKNKGGRPRKDQGEPTKVAKVTATRKGSYRSTLLSR